MNSSGHEVVAFVAQNAHELAGQRLVENRNDLLPIGVVGGGNGPCAHLFARANPNLSGVDSKGFVLLFFIGHSSTSEGGGSIVISLRKARQFAHGAPHYTWSALQGARRSCPRRERTVGAL